MKNLKIGIISDCHLEFEERSFIFNSDIEILIFAGDIHTSPENVKNTIEKIRNITNIPILYILGNHEFYYQIFNNTVKKYKEALESIRNTYVLEKEIFLFKNVRFLGTTLWSDLSDPINEINANLMMNDYRCIYKTKEPLKTIKSIDTYKIFLENKNWIINTLKLKHNGPTVIITHHVPTFSVITSEFKSSPITAAFASSLDDIINEYSPELWIYGHSHFAKNIKIKNTNIINNTIGYPHENRKNPIAFKEILLQFKE